MEVPKILIHTSKTISQIREIGPEFNNWKDSEIEDFFSEWSQEKYGKAWIEHGEEHFYQWATVKPIDVKRQWLDCLARMGGCK